MNQTTKDNLLVKVASGDTSAKFLSTLTALRKEAAKGSVLADAGNYVKDVAGSAVDASKKWLSDPKNQLSLASGVGAGGLLYALTGALPGSKKYRGARLLLSLLGGAGAGYGANQYAAANWPKSEVKEVPVEGNSWITAVPRWMQSLADQVMGVPEAQHNADMAALDTQHFRDTQYKPFQENKQKADKQLRESKAKELALSGEIAARETAEMAPAMINYFNRLKASQK